MFKAFNNIYHEYIDNTQISNTIQAYHFTPEKEKPIEENKKSDN